jgi:hypothetical protein
MVGHYPRRENIRAAHPRSIAISGMRAFAAKCQRLFAVASDAGRSANQDFNARRPTNPPGSVTISYGVFPPGRLPYAVGMTVQDLAAAAGGLTDFASGIRVVRGGTNSRQNLSRHSELHPSPESLPHVSAVARSNAPSYSALATFSRRCHRQLHLGQLFVHGHWGLSTQASRLCRLSQSRQATPGVPLACISASLAWRGCAVHYAIQFRRAG